MKFFVFNVPQLLVHTFRQASSRAVEGCAETQLVSIRASGLHGLLLACLILCPLLCSAQTEDAQGAENVESITPDTTEITVKDADLETVIKIFSRRTNRNYILDERIKGKISIFLPGGVANDDATEILEAALNLKGFASVPISENLWKIIPAKEAIQSTIPTYTTELEASPTQSTITKIVKLQNIGADEVKELLGPLVGSNGMMNAYTGTNSLMIIDSERNISRILEIIEELDVPFSDRDLVVVPIKHATAADVAEKLNQIIGEDSEQSGGSDASSGPQSVADRIALIRQRIRESAGTARGGDDAGAPGGGPGGTTVGARSRAPKIIPDERTNSLILVADDATLARLRALVATLDSEVDLGGFRFWVYRARYANAQELAEVISGLGGGSSGSNRGSLSRDPDVISGARNISGNSAGQQARTQNRLNSQQRTPGQQRSGLNTGSGVTSATLGEDISISADIATNSLVIFADRSGYQKVLELLKELDVKRRQVLVEAMLLEVRVTEGMSTGLEWLTSGGGSDGGVFASNRFGNGLTQLLQDPRGLSGFSVAAASAGSLTLPGNITIPTQSILLNAAQNNSNVNVLSAPTILATDNQEAEIVVGENVPFLASTSTSGDNLSNTFNQINRQDVGITLRLTPQISSDDSVKMQIFTEVSNVAGGADSTLGPTTTVRTSSTTVVAKDSQMVVIGGLMADSVAEDRSGIPFISDIPVIGSLFGQNGSTNIKNNLLIFITPRIIKDQFDARDATKNHSGKLETEIVETGALPLRNDVLQHDDMNSVSELEVEEFPELGTLRPSDTEVHHPNRVARTIHLEPELVERKETPSHSSEQARISVPVQLPPVPEFGGAARRVALEIIDGEEHVSATPFAESVDGSTVYLLLSGELPENARRFFYPGGYYSYDIGSEKIHFRCVETRTASPEESTSGYRLSSFEILSLGQSPWQSSTKK